MKKVNETVHYTLDDLAKNPSGVLDCQYNPDKFSSMIWATKTALIKIDADLNYLFGMLPEENGEDLNVSPEELLEQIAEEVLEKSGGENVDFTKDRVKRMILYCALTPDKICYDEDLKAVDAILTGEEQHKRWLKRGVIAAEKDPKSNRFGRKR